jgi:hypothetical protein
MAATAAAAPAASAAQTDLTESPQGRFATPITLTAGPNGRRNASASGQSRRSRINAAQMMHMIIFVPAASISAQKNPPEAPKPRTGTKV